jgi:soluble cytochrome b562
MNITDVSNNSTVSGAMDGVSGASSYAWSSSTDLSQARTDIQQNSQNFKSLRDALQSGDLASAQSAYSTLQQQIQSASQTVGQNLFDSKSSVGKDFQAIGTSLQAGNLGEAQKDFNTFRQDIRTARHQKAAASDPTTAATGSTDSISTTPSSPSRSGTNILDALA